MGLMCVTFNAVVYPSFVMYHLAHAFLDERMLDADTQRSFGDFYVRISAPRVECCSVLQCVVVFCNVLP